MRASQLQRSTRTCPIRPFRRPWITIPWRMSSGKSFRNNHIPESWQMLENEKYLGGALLQKNYTIDFLNKKRGKNNGTLPQYYLEDDHEAIIPKNIFMRVQEEMARRSSERDLKRFCRTVALFCE
ncbi:MAG: recombinase family protein [Oscillospiraceae bacterium]|nr:recombinase family protein [Oscillospiraceae bacterium]